jgi:hypothetical protein
MIEVAPGTLYVNFFMGYYELVIAVNDVYDEYYGRYVKEYTILEESSTIFKTKRILRDLEQFVS